MMLSCEKELWMVALQIERIHGNGGAAFIARSQKHFKDLAEDEGAALWREIGRRFDELNPA